MLKMWPLCCYVRVPVDRPALQVQTLPAMHSFSAIQTIPAFQTLPASLVIANRVDNGRHPMYDEHVPYGYEKHNVQHTFQRNVPPVRYKQSCAPYGYEQQINVPYPFDKQTSYGIKIVSASSEVLIKKEIFLFSALLPYVINIKFSSTK